MFAWIRFLLITFLFYVVIKFLFSPAFKNIVKALLAIDAADKEDRKNFTKENKSRGPGRRNSDSGEYIDYEEIK
ncbi:MAG: hypothetical protein NZ529_10970 [Cytophagaceae bacterium]|nr:hypothetical protein [Cytophagaceae bacterium]MDW8457307.1 hypothetical protein [Cytophagaceae bacterium]